jgi:hypothetical protein
MFGTPAFDSPLTYFGVLLITLGVYLALSGFGILKIEKYTTPEGVKSWGSGLFLILLGFAILFVLPTYLNGSNQQEVGILGCQDNPNTGIVNAKTPVVLVWGWNTDDETKRDEVISISSFILEVDNKVQDTSKAQQMLKSTTQVFWRLPIGALSPGIHEVKLIRILSQEFTDSNGTTPAGRQGAEICHCECKRPRSVPLASNPPQQETASSLAVT